MAAQTQNSLYQAKKDLVLIVLCHTEHFLDQLGHIALLLLWRMLCVDPNIGQMCANQILNQIKG